MASSNPKTAAIVLGLYFTGLLHGHCPLEHQFQSIFKIQGPIATNAENSPKECPATISGLKLDPITLLMITECKKMAG